MPLYEILCTRCGKVEVYAPTPRSVPFAFCPKCGRAAPRNPKERKGLPPFKSYWSDALCTDSFKQIRVDSREQERELCKKLNCVRVK